MKPKGKYFHSISKQISGWGFLKFITLKTGNKSLFQSEKHYTSITYVTTSPHTHHEGIVHSECGDLNEISSIVLGS